MLIDDSEKLQEGSELNKQNAYTLVVKSKSACFGQKKKSKTQCLNTSLGCHGNHFIFFFFFYCEETIGC